MEKSNNPNTKLKVMGILLLACIVVASLIGLARLSKQSNYNKGVEAVQNQEWNQALQIFQSLDTYKDSYYYRAYIKVRIDYENYLAEGLSAIETKYSYEKFNPASLLYDFSGDKRVKIRAIYYFKDRLLDLNPNNKNLDISDNLKGEYFSFNGLLDNIIELTKEEQEQINEEDERIRQERHIETLDALTTGNDYKEIIDRIKKQYSLELFFTNKKSGELFGIRLEGTKNEEIRTLFFYYNHLYYTEWLNQEENKGHYSYDTNEGIRDLICAINPSYNGYKSEEIVNYCVRYFESKDIWQAKYDSYIEIENTILNAPKPYEPKIGMTAEEIRKSTWGTPKDINRTTTKNIVYEQWVYDNYRYVYLENGVVTAIQD